MGIMRTLLARASSIAVLLRMAEDVEIWWTGK
jgi:hypothetical protein